MASRTITEYRLTTTRADGGVKHWTARSLKMIANRIGLLTSPEPWRYYGSESDRLRGASDYVCCPGTVYDECACGGLTPAEDAAERRAGLPAVVDAKVHTRRVTRTAWEAIEPPDVSVASEVLGRKGMRG